MSRVSRGAATHSQQPTACARAGIPIAMRTLRARTRGSRGYLGGGNAADEGELSMDVLPVLLVLGGLWADPPIASEGVLRTCTRLVRGASCRALEPAAP